MTTCYALGALAGGVAVGWFASWISHGDTESLRNWLSALSGWAAAVGAAAAAYLTLRPLWLQVRQAQRQTDFLVGDADPTLDVFDSTDPFEIGTFDARLVNWNRRPLKIYGFEVRLPRDLQNDYEIYISKYAFNESAERKEGVKNTDSGGHNLRFKRPEHLRGWLNRSQAPNYLFVEFCCVALKGGLPATSVGVTVIVDAVVGGDKQQPISITAEGEFAVRMQASGANA